MCHDYKTPVAIITKINTIDFIFVITLLKLYIPMTGYEHEIGCPMKSNYCTSCHLQLFSHHYYYCNVESYLLLVKFMLSIRCFHLLVCA